MTEQPTPPIRHRPYRMRRRLRSIEETRRRITAAAFDLHATIGPSRTTISAIADRAGVQRHTVYAHFPDLETLYRACTRHGMEVTGMPEPGPWATMTDPGDRLRHGLRELYAWYRANEGMLATILHDVDPTAPAPTEPDPFEIRMESLGAALVEVWAVTDEAAGRTLGAVLAHTLAFDTWRSLTAAGLPDEEVVDLLVALARAVADGSIGQRAQAAPMSPGSSSIP